MTMAFLPQEPANPPGSGKPTSGRHKQAKGGVHSATQPACENIAEMSKAWPLLHVCARHVHTLHVYMAM